MKLTINDNLGSFTWYIGKENVTFRLEQVTATMPDESTIIFDVIWESRSTMIAERGRTYQVKRYYGYAIIDMFNYKLKVDLEDLASKIDIVDYKLRSLEAPA